MATVTTVTDNIRYTFDMANGDTRFIDIENPITDTLVISANIAALDAKIQTGSYSGILVGSDFFDGDTDAYVTKLNKTELIKVTRTTETRTVT